jgi:hypothetical protein
VGCGIRGFDWVAEQDKNLARREVNPGTRSLFYKKCLVVYFIEE